MGSGTTLSFYSSDSSDLSYLLEEEARDELDTGNTDIHSPVCSTIYFLF